MGHRERAYLVYETFEETVEYTVQAMSMKAAIAKVQDTTEDTPFVHAWTSDPKRIWAVRAAEAVSDR